MSEQIYLQDKNIFVSSSLIKTGSFTYQVKNVASYRCVYGGGTIFTIAPFIIGLAVLALYLGSGDPFGIGCGIALIVTGIVMFFTCKTLYLITSAEQVRAYTTYNAVKMQRLVDAIDQAILDNNK